MPAIGVIVNPHASGNRNLSRRLARMREALGPDGEAVATRGLEDIDPALRRFRERRVDLIGVCGGDGSLHHVLTRMIAVWGDRPLPAILPLRAGTMNDLAATVGSRARCPDRVLEKVVHARRTGGELRRIERNLIRVNGSGYGYIVGAGLIVKFLELYYRGRRPGPARAVWLLVRVGCSWLIGTVLVDEICGPIGAMVEADGRRLATERFTMLLAGSIGHIGLGVRPFYLSENPGLGFHLLAGNCSPGELLSRLWRFYRGQPAVLASLEDLAARRVRIEFDQPRPYTINGELFDPVRVLELETGPRVSFVGC